MHSWAHITQIKWQGLIKTLKNGVDTCIGITTACGNVARFAPLFLKGGVGNGRTDGIGIGILVSYDVGGVFCGSDWVIGYRRRGGGRTSWQSMTIRITTGWGEAGKQKPGGYRAGQSGLGHCSSGALDRGRAGWGSGTTTTCCPNSGGKGPVCGIVGYCFQNIIGSSARVV